jgi:hypothetical protein
VEVGGELTVSGNATVSENLTVSGNVSDLNVVSNVNMLHTANTAAIKLNSNVVTEFPRSKKLIKYPRVNLTQNALSNGYAAEASTEKDGTSTGQAYRVFDGVRLERGYHGTNNSYSSGTYQSNESITDANNKIHTGEWIKLQIPATEKMQLRGFTFHPRNETYGPYRIPLEGVFLGSTDGNNWYPIHYFYNFAATNGSIVSSTKYFEPTNHVYYNHIAFVAYKLQNHSNGSVLNFAELDLYGTPEYDPEAHGTDVTVKSYPNVPNTDWLEVYYDAKDLTSISGTIADLSGKSVTGSLNGNVSIDTLNNVKSFSFDGSGDYISGTLTNTGDFDFTVSTWVFETNGTTNNTIWMIGSGSGNSNPNPSVALAVDSAGSLDFFVFSGTEIRMSNFRDTFGINKWHHIVCTRTGTALKYFINGIDQNRPASANLEPLSIAANSIFNIGARTGNQLGNNPMHGSIANFRLFNRALTSDEIYQLYAYQKEYFGHGDLSMTLKAGRLGIGTSEPRAALDVRGDIHANGAPAFPIPVAAFHKLSASTTNTTHSEDIQSGWVAFTGANTTTPGVIEAYTLSGGTTTQGTSSGVVVKLCKKGMYKLEAGFAINTQDGINSHIGIGIYPVSNSYIPGNTSRVHYTLGGSGSLAGYFYIPGSTNNINQQFNMTQILRVSEGPGYAYVTITPNSNDSTHFQFQNWASYPHGVMYVTYLG